MWKRTALSVSIWLIAWQGSCSAAALHPTDVAARPGGEVWVGVVAEGMPALGPGRLSLWVLRRATNAGDGEALVTDVVAGPLLSGGSTLIHRFAAADGSPSDRPTRRLLAAWLPPFNSGLGGGPGSIGPTAAEGELLRFRVRVPDSAAPGDLFDLCLAAPPSPLEELYPADLCDSSGAPLTVTLGSATLLVDPPDTAPPLRLGPAAGRPGEAVTVSLDCHADLRPVRVALTLSVAASGAPPLSAPQVEPADGWSVAGTEAGGWRLELASTGEGSSGPLAALRFALPSSAVTGTAYRIEAADARLVDVGGRERSGPELVAPGEVRVEWGCIRGDVDGSGQVSAGDALLVLRFLVLGEPLPGPCGAWAADANGDGEVSLGDAVRVLRAALLGAPAG